MRIAIGQINPRVADLAGNAERIRIVAENAAEQGAELIVVPELCLTGAPPLDLLLDPGFVDVAVETTEALARDLAALPPVVVGTIARPPGSVSGRPGLHNAAALLDKGRIRATAAKQILPCRDVFHEPRWFVPGSPAPLAAAAGEQVGLLVGDDLWGATAEVDPARSLVGAGATLLVAPCASPYGPGARDARLEAARRARCPIVVANLVGGQDDLVFDGGSFALDASGCLVAELERFEEQVLVFDLDRPEPGVRDAVPQSAELYGALVLGVRDFVRKNRLRGAVLGLSGGIDSAVVACVARDALGPAAVTGIAMPSRFTDPRSIDTARELASRLRIGFEIVPIDPLHDTAERVLEPVLAGLGSPTWQDTTFENVQARLRTMILMAYLNRRGGVLLNTSNKTELSVGYGTLYGDLAGTVSVLGDVTKPQVYALARWVNRGEEVIPRFMIERPPSAELKSDQVDPFDYDVVSPVVESLILGRPLPEGSAPAEVTRLRKLIRGSEHKRRLAGIVIKVSERAFGPGRLMPVTRGDSV